MLEFLMTSSIWTSKPALFMSKETKMTLSPSLVFVSKLLARSHRTASLYLPLFSSSRAPSMLSIFQSLLPLKFKRFESTDFEYSTLARWSAAPLTPDSKDIARIWTLYHSKPSQSPSASLLCTLTPPNSFVNAVTTHWSSAYSPY